MIEFILFFACAFIFFKLGAACERIRQGVKSAQRAGDVDLTGVRGINTRER